MKWLITGTVLGAVFLGVVYTAGSGGFGEPQLQREPLPSRRADTVAVKRNLAQEQVYRRLGSAAPDKQILFGDFHVHSTFSADAFMMSLPVTGGEGAHPISDACDYARFCASLDFWSINDHAEMMTPSRWTETVEAIRQCNRVNGEDADMNPDMVAFLGWEWTQSAYTPALHYGHKNVILKGTADKDITARPIASGPAPGDVSMLDSAPPKLGFGLYALLNSADGMLDLARYNAHILAPPACADDVPSPQLPIDCRESAVTPGELFRKLDEWDVDSLVIPHGTTWGMYTPPGANWDKQLSETAHDPKRQTLIEVFSGHGNSEEYRDFRAVEYDADGNRRCPAPQKNYLPNCWRAGEIIEQRCLAQFEEVDDEARSTCRERAALTRQLFVDADGNMGWKVVPGTTPADWLDAGQCNDCFQPSFNYRPGNSVQYIMAQGRPQAAPDFKNFRFGFIASSDNHSSRPGTGYKEIERSRITEARFEEIPKSSFRPEEAVAAKPRVADFRDEGLPIFRWPFERSGSFFLTGGLVALHAEGRDRQAIWDGLKRREVYGTSGPRILLWFDYIDGQTRVPMGGEITSTAAPRFEVRAAGSFEQKPGCPLAITSVVPAQSLQRLCGAECYNPSDQRRAISRIEVVRITPRKYAGEDTRDLIEDPWRVFDCPANGNGCQVAFSDDEYPALARDAVYYVRAIEVPSLAVGAQPIVCERDQRGRCITLTDSCASRPEGDDCLSNTEERAWSSPIFVDYR